MTPREQIIECMLNRNPENFALKAATLVIKLNGVEQLYLMATNRDRLQTNKNQQTLLFRSAYTLEYIYFNHPTLFAPLLERFITDYPNCSNASAKRIFAKMMADILKSHKPTANQQEAIAEATVSWIIEPKTKVAVKVWAMSVLKILKPDVMWLNDIWKDLEDSVTNEATPAVIVRLKRGWV